jgi:pantoate--beta-alanine ligase
MVRDLNVPVEVIVRPTLREKDGLALSSRNVYLDPSQRAASAVLSEALADCERAFRQGERDAELLKRLIVERINSAPGAVIDYVAVVDGDTLAGLARVEGPALVALAVRFGPTRLIDNVQLTP